MAKRVGPASEVDAYCTKCRLDLTHRVIAMDGDVIKKVECLTCHGHHQYRRPKSAEPPARRAAARAGPPPSKRSAAAAARSARLKEWETAIAGRGAAEFTAYTMSAPLAVGQLLRHAKFGDGVVRELIEGNKAAVLFQDGPHTLVHG